MKRVTLLIALLAVVAAGCARQAETTRDTAAVDFDFTVATLEGDTFDGRTLAGRPAVLWFWAPWCPTCAAEAPHVSEITERYQGRVNVIGVAGLGELAAMHRFVENTKSGNVTHLADEQGVVWRRFEVSAQSTYVLLDASGVVVHRGYLDEAELDRRVSELAG